MKKAGICVLILATTAIILNAQEIGIAARVNGVDITVFRLERFFDEYSRAQGGGVQLITSPTVYKRMKRQALDQLIDREILWQEAQRREITVSDGRVKEVLQELEGKFKNREGYLRQLKAMGFDDESYAAYIRQDLAIERLMETAVETSPVSDVDMEDFYSQNRAQFVQPESVWARHILIKVEAGADDAARKAAENKAADILEALKEGNDFARLAREYSDDSSSQAGGDLGWIARGQMVKPFEDTAFALEPGQISDPVRTVFGLHIIKLEEKRPEARVSLADVKDRLRRYLEGVKRQEATRQFLDRLRAAAKIERVLPL